MLRPVSPNISVITNFGCKTGCWYCIWKDHPLKGIKLETDWSKLEEFLSRYKDKGKVSVSGGGDCLFDYDKYKPWWDKFFSLAEKFNLLVDIHSREKFINRSFWAKVNRCVISSDVLDDCVSYLLYLIDRTKIRLVHVVTANTTEKDIKRYLEFSRWSGCQFTMKQLSKYNDNGNYKMFSRMFPDVFSLDEGDYNIYFMPNNTITKDYKNPEITDAIRRS